MKKILLAIMVLSCAMLSCTKKDCHCTYYDESGVELPNYSYDYEDMVVANCSELDTKVEGNRGYVCK